LTGKIENQEIIKAFKVGSDTEKLLIEDSDGYAQEVKIRVPISGYDIGSEITINSSSDGETYEKQ